MSEVVQFPGVDPPPEGFSRGYVDQVHAKGFRDLEGDVCDLDRMGEISINLIMSCSASEDGVHDLELATFAVFQLVKMLKEFRASYYKRWDNEAGPS